MIRTDAIWLATQPLDMGAGIGSALACIVNVFGVAHPHTAHLCANRRANRMKVLVHTASASGWRPRLHRSHFVWPAPRTQTQLSLSRHQLDSLVLGLPWSHLGELVAAMKDAMLGRQADLRAGEQPVATA